jgi:RNA-directed DNA polymerase
MPRPRPTSREGGHRLTRAFGPLVIPPLPPRIVADLNPLLRGWFGYFKQARPRLFRRLDQFIRRRLRAVLRKQDRRPSMGCSEADHRRWTNAFFADQGLFTLLTAFEDARYPR